MKKKILAAILIGLFSGGCLFSLSLEDLGQGEDLQNLEVKAETNEAGEITSIDITAETKKEVAGDEAIAEAVGEAIKEGTSVLPTQ